MLQKVSSSENYEFESASFFLMINFVLLFVYGGDESIDVAFFSFHKDKMFVLE